MNQRQYDATTNTIVTRGESQHKLSVAWNYTENDDGYIELARDGVVVWAGYADEAPPSVLCQLPRSQKVS